MQAVDWSIVAVYAIGVLGLGFYFSRKAGRSVEDYFVAGRKLPWWALGLSSAASYSGAGAAPAFTMLVFTGGLLGNGVWWVPWIIWTPIVAVFWARFWRRLKLTTTAELIEIRYQGRAAELYRFIYAAYMVAFAVLLMAYTTGFIREAFAPILDLQPLELQILGGHLVLTEEHQIIFGCGLLVLFYVTAAGLLGAVYSDVPQFVVFLLGNVVLIPIILSQTGGLASVFERVFETRGDEFFKALPPTESLSGMMILALTIQGLFFAASPTGGEGYTAQRFLGAKNIAHAQLGQVLNAVLSLFVRTVPFFFLGVIGAALYAPDTLEEPARLWGLLVARYSVLGLTGLLVTAELAAYMSTVDTEVNWGASFLINDMYRRFVRRDGSSRHYVAVSRLFSALLLVTATALALEVRGMRDWFLFINSVMVSFMLPLGWLRFFWWRLNIYGEAVGVLGSIPLGYTVWFVLGFKDRPFWQGFLILFLLGFGLILLVTLLTRPEESSTLKRFYLRCRPPGLWGPVTRELSSQELLAIREENRGGLIECLLGIGMLAAAGGAFTSFFAGQLLLATGMLLLGAACGTLFVLRWKRRGLFASLRGPTPPSADATTAQPPA